MYIHIENIKYVCNAYHNSLENHDSITIPFGIVLQLKLTKDKISKCFSN